MKKLKLVTIIGTRPEIIRLSVIIKKCDQFFDHTLIHTGQNHDYELNEVFFKDLNIKLNECKSEFSKVKPKVDELRGAL